MNELHARLADRKVTLDLDQPAREWLCKSSTACRPILSSLSVSLILLFFPSFLCSCWRGSLQGTRGFEPAFGARPLNRVISRFLMNPLAKALLDGSVHDGEQVRFAVASGELRLVPNHTPASGTAADEKK